MCYEKKVLAELDRNASEVTSSQKKAYTPVCFEIHMINLQLPSQSLPAVL